MAELQSQVNQERAKCDRAIAGLKDDLAKKVRPAILRQARFESMIEQFIKRHRRQCKRMYRKFKFGSLSFARNKIDVRLNVPLAAERMGKP
jgi:hypothetical protein